MLFILHSMAFLPGIALLPMLANGLRHLRQPRAVFGQFRDFRRREVFDAVLRRVAKRLEQPRRNEYGAILSPDCQWHLQAEAE